MYWGLCGFGNEAIHVAWFKDGIMYKGGLSLGPPLVPRFYILSYALSDRFHHFIKVYRLKYSSGKLYAD